MLKPLSDLQRTLVDIDGDLFASYKDIRGEYETASLRIIVDHIQNDPFSASSRVRIQVDQNKARFPEEFISTPESLIAARDFLARQLAYETAKFSRQRGTGKSGEIYFPQPGQEVLGRSSVQYIDEKYWEARFFVGLPASGKHVIGHIAVEVLCQDMTRIAEKCLFYESINKKQLKKHVDHYLDARFIRTWLQNNKYVAFISENAILPRSKDGFKPDNNATPFNCDELIYKNLELPNRGEIKGMAIPEGITVITGPAGSGKSVFMDALCKGVYDHIPGDGRGYVITRNDAVYVNVEPERTFAGIDLDHFRLTNKSYEKGSESIPPFLRNKLSQMVNMTEVLELGSKTLLFDENDLTPDFLHSDDQYFKNNENTLSNLLGELKAGGISTIISTRSIPEFIKKADQVYLFNGEHTVELIENPEREEALENTESIKIKMRSPNPRTITPKKGNKSVLIASRGTETMIFGNLDIDVSHLKSIVEQGQLDAIGQSINYARRNLMGEKYALKNISSRVENDINHLGWDAIDNRKMGIYVEFRPIDFGMILNRIPGLENLD